MQNNLQKSKLSSKNIDEKGFLQTVVQNCLFSKFCFKIFKCIQINHILCMVNVI